MMDIMEDTEFWADVAAEELERALTMIGIAVNGVRGDDEGDVYISFKGIREAESFMVLSMTGDRTAGTVYDRAVASCVTLGSLDDSAPDAVIDAAQDTGWTWVIHPTMTGAVVGWHVMAVLPSNDAVTVTARLRARVNAGAL